MFGAAAAIWPVPKVELVYRDTGGPNPAQAKRLAEELLVRDKVAILGGLYLSPEAAAAAPAVNETKTPTLLFNAASPSLMPASAYFVRMGQNISSRRGLAPNGPAAKASRAAIPWLATIRRVMTRKRPLSRPSPPPEGRSWARIACR